jgi:hypothetical protein
MSLLSHIEGDIKHAADTTQGNCIKFGIIFDSKEINRLQIPLQK